MITRLLIHLLPILVPFILYIAWTKVIHGRPVTAKEGPWLWLMASGVVLAFCVLIGARLMFEGAPAGSQYIPPHMEDGRLVPGEFLTRPKE